jgi:hypothetical protein
MCATRAITALDLAVSSSYMGEVVVYAGNGDGTF